MPHASSDDSPRNHRPPYTQPGRGEWMRKAVPNLRRQLRLWAGGQRVQGSQSCLEPAPRSPPINQLQSPTTLKRTWRVIVAGHCGPLEKGCSSSFVFGGRFGVQRLLCLLFLSALY
ncbi:hypothetical protein CEXT_794671 [Caerostris extrusa]|uniref:Uncharacterized protein n=1 Tax=Caerostris extrusa TaxID=172846 RepID=A0AAV4TQA3_CAEEX|nr:hypothetical protein CEXT_794671 [Caerostris extrusa]